MERRRLVILLVGLFLLIMGSPRPTQGQAIKIGTSLKTHPVFAMPMLAAEEKGFWKQNEVAVEWVPFRGGAEMQRAMAAEAVDMGMDGSLGQILAQGRGLPATMVAHPGVESDFFVFVRQDSPIKSGKDFKKGAKVGVTNLGGSAHAYGLAWVRAAGLEKEIRFVAVGDTVAQIASMRTGMNDGELLTLFAVAPVRVKGEIREAVKLREYLPAKWLERVLAARNPLIEKRPEVVRKVIKAFFQATDFIMKERTWAMETMKSFSGYSPEAAELLYPALRYNPDGRFEKEAVENTLKFLVDYGLLPRDKAPAAETLYTNKFVS